LVRGHKARLFAWVQSNPYLRAFGFGLTFYPTVMVYAWLIAYMVFGIKIL
jgi:hypothetical protein